MIHNNFECSGPSLHSNIALTLASVLDSLGLNGQEVLLANNLNQDELRRSATRIPQSSLQRLWRDGVQISRNEDLGLRFAEHFHPASTHGLWVCCAASETLLSALQRLAKHYRVISTFSRVDIIENDTEFALHLIYPALEAASIHESTDAEIAMLIHLCRFALSNNLNALRVEMQRPAPMNTEKFTAYFRCPITFSANKNCLIFDKRILKQQLPASNPAIAHANEQVIVEYLRAFDEGDIVNRIKSFIIDALPHGIPNQNKVAMLMNISTRTLKRKLASKGTSYAELLEQTQCKLATDYLSNTKRSVGDLSSLLGYTEPSNFTRSFKKWTKLTPLEYRQRHS